MAWAFDVNIVGITGGALAYRLVELLESVGWVRRAASDGTTFDIVNGASVTHGGTTAGGFDRASAWIVLEAPDDDSGVLVRLCLQRGSASSGDIRAKVSFDSAFTGGSPSATVTPSAATQYTIRGGGTDAVPTYGSWVPTAGTRTYHLVAEDEAPWCFAGWGTVNGFANGALGLAMDWCVDGSHPVEDTNPYVFYFADASGGSTSIWGVTSLGTTTNVWTKGAGSTFSNASYENYRDGNAATAAIPQGLVVNPHTGRDDLYSIWVAERSPSAIGHKGQLHMGRWVGRLAASTSRGHRFSVDATADWVNAGQVALPWNGSVVTNGPGTTSSATIWGETSVIPDDAPEISSATVGPVASGQTVQVDITHPLGVDLLVGVVIQAVWDSKNIQEMVYDTAFGAMYQGASNGGSPITNGFRFLFTRDGGWPATDLEVRARAYDSNGHTTGEVFVLTTVLPSTPSAAPAMAIGSGPGGLGLGFD